MIQSECFIYSRSSTEWIRGHISNIFIDEVTNAEWMVVRYGQKTKRIQRFNVCLRPIDGGDVDYNELFKTLMRQITNRLKAANVYSITQIASRQIDDLDTRPLPPS